MSTRDYDPLMLKESLQSSYARMEQEIRAKLEVDIQQQLERLFLANDVKIFLDQGMATVPPSNYASNVMSQKQNYLSNYQQLVNAYQMNVQQQMLANLHSIPFPAAAPSTTPPPPPNKVIELGSEYKLVRFNGNWTLQHKPCVPDGTYSPHAFLAPKEIFTIDEDGVCGGCGGSADESLVMQLNLRKLER